MANRLSSWRSEKSTFVEILKLDLKGLVSNSKVRCISASGLHLFKEFWPWRKRGGSRGDRELPGCFYHCQILLFCRPDHGYRVLVCSSANSYMRVAGSTGLTTWISKPASLVFCRSSSCPHPVTAMIFIRRPHSWLRIIRHAS